MYTSCPKCSTCFRVTDRHLAIANGKVRCGKCSAVFNALDYAVDKLPAEQVTSAAQTSTTAQTTTAAKPATATQPQDSAEATQAKHQQIRESLVNLASSTNELKLNSEKAAVAKQTSASAAEIKTDQAHPDETLIADLASIDDQQLDEIAHEDNPVTHIDQASQASHFDDDEDDIFSTNIDLDSAIENLAHDADEIIIDSHEEKLSEYTSSKNNISGETTITDGESVLDFDDNDHTATSVDQIFEEMQGQLPLNMQPYEYHADKHDDDDFEIVDFDEDDILAGEEDDFIDDEHEDEDQDITHDFEVATIAPGDEIIEDDILQDEVIDEDELFDQVDLSDFQESDLQEDIVIDDLNNSSPIFNSSQSAEGKTSLKDTSPEGVPFKLRNNLERMEAATGSQKLQYVFVAGFFTLLIISFMQLTYFRSHDLLNLIPQSRALITAYCDVMPCQYSGPRDVKKIKLISRDVRLHPKEKSALLISASMINKADHAQPYPKIHIKLSDISGNLVAQRTFNSKTYMGKLSTPFLLMKPNTPVHINFEVIDPGKDAVNFEFSFR